MNSQLDDIRRKARLLENEIDTKLVSLNKINSSASGAAGTATYANESSKLAGKRAVFESLSTDIEELLSKLNKFNNEMKDQVDNGGSEFNQPTLYHTVRRHRDILRDYSTEFSRTCTNIRNQLQREELLSGSSSSIEPEVAYSVNNRAKTSDYALRETDRINSCDRLLNDHISIAMSVKENLTGQRSFLADTNKKLYQLTKKYPAINSVMQKIRLKKRKDTLVLACVITTCLILFFLYAMR